MLAEIAAAEDADLRKIREEQEKFNQLSDKEKEEILIDGLYSHW